MGKTFAMLYVMGNIIALCATGFLVGPKKQCKTMFKETRRVACIVYMIMLVVVFVVAVTKGELVGLVLLLLIIQACAAVWYSASYIPYGRKMIINCCKSTVLKSCYGSG